MCNCAGHNKKICSSACVAETIRARWTNVASMMMLNSTPDMLRMSGLRIIAAECTACKQAFDVPISAVDLPGDTPLSAVSRLRPQVCQT